MINLLWLLLWLSRTADGQKLVVVIAEGLSGAYFHRFSHLSGLRVFEEEGVWSTRLFPVFPTLPLPNRHTLLTGVLPRKHGMMSDFVFNWRTGQEFLNFTQDSDFSKSEWWMTEPIYVTATKAKASVAMFFFPECNVDWAPPPHLCVPPRKDGMTFADERIAKIVVEATKTHDLVLVHHSSIREQIANIGPKNANERTATEVDKFQQALERLTAQARERIDLNVIVVSPHGLVDVPRRNVRVLDDYLPMELLQMSVGSGAVKQLIAM
ncbi:type I phosphodiesterase / nucleotide pyrophosphatase, partial [Oesophagostomum dentatum]